jgi:hypothetical protein
MAAATLVSVKEYLSTSYSPDREYLDGRIVERNLGREDAQLDSTKPVGLFLGPAQGWRSKPFRNSESK